MIERPKLRNVEPVPAEVNGRRVIALRDPHQIAEKMIAVPEDIFFILTLFDGEHTVLDIQAEYMRRYGELIFSDRVREIIEMMDESFLLESERFEARRCEVVEKFRCARVRPPSHAGNGYEASKARLRAQLDSFFEPPEGPGAPAPRPGAPPLDVLGAALSAAERPPVKGIIAPHIDLLRGGHCYAHAWHALAEACEAETFVILGTVHVPMKNFFTATCKSFKTPIGQMAADGEFIDALAKRLGERLFEDEYVHKFEHSIEFQVIFLQHMLGGGAKARIVPVLCSSFLEAAKAGPSTMLRAAMSGSALLTAPSLSRGLSNGGGPQAVPEVKEFVAALKKCVAASGKRVCLVASADLAHVGPRFGDRRPLSAVALSDVESEDREMLQHVEKLDADGFYRSIAKDDDARHICGFPPIYILLRTIAASEGKLLRYAQAADPSGHGCVSFAAMAFT